jgi:AcrR family transcriptional regulator
MKGKKPKPQVSKKEQIIESALKCFFKNGVAGTRFKEIADGANVDQPLIHYYYPHFDALFTDVVAKVLESLKQTTFEWLEKNPNDPMKTLRNYCFAPFDWIKKEPGLFSIWLYFYHLSSFHPEFSKLDISVREGGRDRISFLLYRGLEKGVFQKSENTTVREMALLIQGLITGNSIMAGTEDHKLLDRYALLTADHVTQFLQPK